MTDAPSWDALLRRTSRTDEITEQWADNGRRLMPGHRGHRGRVTAVAVAGDTSQRRFVGKLTLQVLDA